MKEGILNMAKKVTVIVLSIALVLIVGVGAFLFLSNSSDSDNKKTEETYASKEVYLDEDKSDEKYIVDDSDSETAESTQYSDDFIPSDENTSDNTDDLVTTNFTIEKIVDHTTDEEVSGRVVFGKSFNQDDNYITFDSNGNFEINLSGYLDKATKGKFTDYGNIIYVEFDDGRAAEYNVRHTDDGIISYIVVNYGDYDVYFS
jgi:flagellar basal body-associated protein FliL